VAACQVGRHMAVKVIDHRPGTEWVVDRLDGLGMRHGPLAIVANNAGPARSLIDDANAAGLAVEPYGPTDYVVACQTFFDLVANDQLRHQGQPELDSAVHAAGRRTVAGSWVFGRTAAGGDIAALVAAAVAAHRAGRPHLVPVVIVGDT
jgi:hypothetical protein